MKKLVNILLTVVVLAALAWTLVRGFGHRHHGDDSDAEKAAGDVPKEEEKAEAFVVSLEKEKWKALGIEKDQPATAELKPQRVAFGRVLDPTPLVTLDGELAAAEAALSVSRAENERSQKLLAGGENTSRKSAEAAEAQFRADEIKADGLRRRTRIEWGTAIAELGSTERREFVEQLVRGDAVLIRVDVLAGEVLAENPQTARVLVLGREKQPIETQSITPAADVDPKTQAQGFILRVNRPPFALRPGMALTAWLELPEKPRAGFALPRSAILRHDGRAWVYVQEEDEKFVRKPVVLDTPLDGDKGWFVAAESGGITADDLIVVTGAQSLLSEELKAQGGSEPD